MTQRVNIENIVSRDIPFIAKLEEHIFSDSWNENMLRQHLQNTNSLQLKLTNNSGTIIGYLITSCVLDEINIDIIAIDEHYRSNGYATMLLSRLEQMVRQTAKVIMLEVREKNLPAITLYKKLGFEEVGKRKNYYSNPTDNAILMNKLL